MKQFAPWGYQEYCIGRIVTDPAVGLFLGMGLGKTVITLSAISVLKYDMFCIRKVLIIAPKKVAEATWQKEGQTWEHLRLLRFSTVLGTHRKRMEALHTSADVYVINRENIPWLVEYYRNDWPFDMVVLDESSSFKNSKAKRFRALKAVRRKIVRIVALTGTPAPNSTLDLWAQVYLLDQGARLGKTITGFRDQYFSPDKRGRDVIYSYAPKSGADQSIRERIGDICISMQSEDYLKLPQMITADIPVVLDSRARKAYDRLEREMLLEVDENTIDAGTAAVLTNKLLQLCNGAVYGQDKQVAEIHNCKLEAFLETVEKLSGQPALVMYSYQHDLDRIMRALSKSKLCVRVYRKAQDQEDWNAGDIDLLLAHPASCAYGLNLQAGGNHIIWFGLCWSLELYLQANKRLHRQGQEKPVFVHRIAVQDSADVDVLRSLACKNDVQSTLLDALKARICNIKRGQGNDSEKISESGFPAE